MKSKDFHYAIDAAQLILKCRQNLHQIIYPKSETREERHDGAANCFSNNTQTHPPDSIAAGINPNVLDLDRTLLSVEQVIHYHLLTMVEDTKAKMQLCDIHRPRDEDVIDVRNDANIQHASMAKPIYSVQTSTTDSLNQTLQELKRLSTEKYNSAQANNKINDRNKTLQNNLTPNDPYPNRVFQTSQTSSRHEHGRPFYPSSHDFLSDRFDAPLSPSSSFASISPSSSFQFTISPEKSALDSLLFRLIVILQLCLIRIEEAKNVIGNRSKIPWTIVLTSATIGVATSSPYLLPPTCIKSCTGVGKGLGFAGTAMILRKGWMKICVNTRLLNTSLSLEDWQQQWILLQSVGLGEKGKDEQQKHLLRLIPIKRSYSIWGSEANFRYNVLKWIMDCLYASVGTAMRVTKPANSKTQKRSIWMPLTAAVAASYYAIVGPGGKSAEVLSSSTGSELMQNAWGMVSLPAVKTLSLQASRLLKGAAIAERINICGVPCFILSKDPCPALSTAIKRYRRQQRRESSHLGTILEENLPYDNSKARTINLCEYPRKDVIYHLTGGGFFAHTLAGDIPFLLDWSATTKSVIICPEYALLPDHKFPVAINEITKVYSSIVNGDVAPLIGLQTGRIIVTGESTGGNLGAALCIKLCIDGLVDVKPLRGQKHRSDDRSSVDLGKDIHSDIDSIGGVRLPDALLLW